MQTYLVPLEQWDHYKMAISTPTMASIHTKTCYLFTGIMGFSCLIISKTIIPLFNNLVTNTHLNKVPCTCRTAGSLKLSPPPTMASIHTTSVLLYSSVAEMCKKRVWPTWLAVIFGVFSSDNSDPLTCQPIKPVVTLHSKEVADPSVALTDVGVLTKPGIVIK